MMARLEKVLPLAHPGLVEDVSIIDSRPWTKYHQTCLQAAQYNFAFHVFSFFFVIGRGVVDACMYLCRQEAVLFIVRVLKNESLPGFGTTL